MTSQSTPSPSPRGLSPSESSERNNTAGLTTLAAAPVLPAPDAIDIVVGERAMGFFGVLEESPPLVSFVGEGAGEDRGEKPGRKEPVKFLAEACGEDGEVEEAWWGVSSLLPIPSVNQIL